MVIESADTEAMEQETAAQKLRRSRRQDEIALYIRFPAFVIEGLDELVEDDFQRRGSSNRSDVIRVLILEAVERKRKERSG